MGLKNMQIDIHNNIYFSNDGIKFRELERLIVDHKFSYSIILKNSKSELTKWINDQLAILNDPFYNFSTKCYWILNGLREFPKCKNCGKPFIHKNIVLAKGYPEYCSTRCSNSSNLVKQKKVDSYMVHYGVSSPAKSDEVKLKTKETCLSRYGTDHVWKNSVIKRKCKETVLKHYNVENVSQSDIIKEKKIQSSKSRYNCDCVFQSDEVKEKIKNTVRNRYGVDNVSQCQSIKDKIEYTCQSRYGSSSYLESEEFKRFIFDYNMDKYNTPYYVSSDEFKAKRRNTCLSRYGFEYAMQNDDVQEKYRRTILDTYGVDNISKLKEIQAKKENTCLANNGVKYGILTKECIDSIRKSKRKSSFENFIRNNEYDEPLFTLEEYLSNDRLDFLKFKCKKCGNIFESQHYDGFHDRCPICYPVTASTSISEIEISNYIKELGFDVVNRDRNILDGKELDIYIPSKNIAFEFDGLYWHNLFNCHGDKNYHLNKTELCKSKNIQLIHIFEDEWLFKKDLVKSVIENHLGVYDHTIYARSCTVKKIEDDSYMHFLDSNHLQGKVLSSINYGLYYNDELVSLMTFGSYRKVTGLESKDNEYELLRFCNKVGYHIPGAASRLLKHFIKDYNPDKLISYADRRWSQGKLYEALGFRFIKSTVPNYWYIIGNKREHRFNWRKDQLSNKLKIYKDDLSEVENMKLNGYHQIFDCGSLLYEMIFTKGNTNDQNS